MTTDEKFTLAVSLLQQVCQEGRFGRAEIYKMLGQQLKPNIPYEDRKSYQSIRVPRARNGVRPDIREGRRV